MKSLDYDGEALVIKFRVPTVDFYPMVNIVKQCEGRRFDPVKKVWIALPLQSNIDLLVGNGFVPTPAVKGLWHNKPVIEKEAERLADIDTSKLDPAMYPYQIDGVRWLEAHKGTGVVGLPVGMGKTNIAASYARLHPEDRPVLVVCPACVKFNWQREIKKWVGESSIVLSGNSPYRINERYGWVIINYDILLAWVDMLKARKFKYIIGDESAYVNNPKAQRTKAFVSLARSIPKRVFLSATPIRNRPAEFFTVLNLVDKVTFSSRYKYQQRYCNPTYTGWGWEYKGISNEEELFSLVSRVMFRRKKEDVLKDLPAKQNIIVPFTLGDKEQRDYNKASAEFLAWVQSTKAKKKLDGKAHIETLRQLAYIGKRNGVIEWIENFLESGESLVVFAWHTNAIDDIYEAFRKVAVVVDGRTSSKDKQLHIDAFQEGKKQLFIGQITAAGIGINLTVASSLAIIEFPWTPGDLEQVKGRIDRIGQKSPTVSYYYLVGAGTVDEDTALLLDEKSKMLNQTLDGEAGDNIFGVDIYDMLSDLYQKKEAT